jgi:hypothetical protein
MVNQMHHRPPLKIPHLVALWLGLSGTVSACVPAISILDESRTRGACQWTDDEAHTVACVGLRTRGQAEPRRLDHERSSLGWQRI